MTFEDIRKALDSALKAGSFGGLPVTLEGSGFNPNLATPYIAAVLIPSQPVQSTLGESGTDFHEGLYQISVYYPSATGSGVITRKADEIAVVFKSGARFEWESICVLVNNVGTNQLRFDRGWAILDLTVDYSSFVARIP